MKSRHAFTLVELLILLAIFTALLGLALSLARNKAIERQKEAARAAKIEASAPRIQTGIGTDFTFTNALLPEPTNSTPAKPSDFDDDSKYRIITDGERFKIVYPNDHTNKVVSFATCDEAQTAIHRLVFVLKNPASEQEITITGFTNAVCK